MSFSIVIPARNEERYLPQCLEAISHAARHVSAPIEVIVVLNRCSDRTEEIARAWGARIVHEDSKNLARIRNAGARAATGSWIVTVDADSRMSENMLEAVESVLRDPCYIGGGVLILPERLSLGIALTMAMLVPVALWYGISGGLFYCRKADFDALGGFNEELVSVEDIDFARRLRALGKRRGLRFKHLLRAHIVTSCRKFDRLGDWYFLRHPAETILLFRGRHQAAADKIWYDFER